MRHVPAHPVRYFVTHKFAANLVETYRKANGPGGTTLEGMNAVLGPFLRAYNRALEQLPMHERPSDIRFQKKELALFLHVAANQVSGERMYSLPPDVVEGLRSDAEKPPRLLNIRQLPAKAFYIHFGPQQDFDLWGEGYYVDGAYFSWWGQDHPVQIVLTRYERTWIIQALQTS